MKRVIFLQVRPHSLPPGFARFRCSLSPRSSSCWHPVRFPRKVSEMRAHP